MDELQPIPKLVEADTQVVEQPAVGEIDRSAGVIVFTIAGTLSRTRRRSRSAARAASAGT
jgi:hypothetical protein